MVCYQPPPPLVLSLLSTRYDLNTFQGSLPSLLASIEGIPILQQITQYTVQYEVQYNTNTSFPLLIIANVIFQLKTRIINCSQFYRVLCRINVVRRSFKMPLLRRRTAASDAEMRRHSYLPTDSNTLNPILDFDDLPDGRASEQMPRRPSPGEFQSSAEPETIAPLPLPPMLNRPATDYPTALQRLGTPPIQEESSKHRRFSMLRFRHASDSQLSSKSRLQAQNASIPEDVPPIPHRKYFPFDVFPQTFRGILLFLTFSWTIKIAC